jgi:hypothetical protein
MAGKRRSAAALGQGQQRLDRVGQRPAGAGGGTRVLLDQKAAQPLQVDHGFRRENDPGKPAPSSDRRWHWGEKRAVLTDAAYAITDSERIPNGKNRGLPRHKRI